MKGARDFPAAHAKRPFVLPVLVLAACGGGNEQLPPPPAPTATAAPPAPPPPAQTAQAPAPKPPLADLGMAVKSAAEALNGHDAKKVADAYADDALISVAGLNEVSGKAQIQSNMQEWFDTFSKIKIGFSRVWMKSDVDGPRVGPERHAHRRALRREGDRSADRPHGRSACSRSIRTAT